MTKQTEIKITVALDEKNHPKTIHWQASDNPAGEDKREAKAMLISFFDKEDKDMSMAFASLLSSPAGLSEACQCIVLG